NSKFPPVFSVTMSRIASIPAVTARGLPKIEMFQVIFSAAFASPIGNAQAAATAKMAAPFIRLMRRLLFVQPLEHGAASSGSSPRRSLLLLYYPVDSKVRTASELD